MFPHSSRKTPETFSITFTTEYTDGILFWQSQDGLVGNGGDFLALVVEDGYPSLQYELGGGPANMTLETRVNDGNLHKLEITREGRKGELVLNDKISVSGSSKENAIHNFTKKKFIFSDKGCCTKFESFLIRGDWHVVFFNFLLHSFVITY